MRKIGLDGRRRSFDITRKLHVDHDIGVRSDLIGRRRLTEMIFDTGGVFGFRRWVGAVADRSGDPVFKLRDVDAVYLERCQLVNNNYFAATASCCSFTPFSKQSRFIATFTSRRLVTLEYR